LLVMRQSQVNNDVIMEAEGSKALKAITSLAVTTQQTEKTIVIRSCDSIYYYYYYYYYYYSYTLDVGYRDQNNMVTKRCCGAV
jgi:hypothetical protein